MNEEELIVNEDDYIVDLLLSTEFDWNQLQVNENKSVEFSYEQEDWLSSCY